MYLYFQSEDQKKHQERIEKLATILGGEVSIALNLQFLIRNNHTDMLILKQTKEAVRNSVCHTATVIANSLMHCGTTSDQFLRDNLEWLARATNWAKFSATASLGVIHKGHENEALHLMSSYLPKDSGSSAGYSEGGGLYALGLIHANHGAAIIDYLLNQLKEASNEVVRHGGCLGLGLAAMGTHRQGLCFLYVYNTFFNFCIFLSNDLLIPTLNICICFSLLRILKFLSSMPMVGSYVLDKIEKVLGRKSFSRDKK